MSREWQQLNQIQKQKEKEEETSNSTKGHETNDNGKEMREEKNKANEQLKAFHLLGAIYALVSSSTTYLLCLYTYLRYWKNAFRISFPIVLDTILAKYSIGSFAMYVPAYVQSCVPGTGQFLKEESPSWRVVVVDPYATVRGILCGILMQDMVWLFHEDGDGMNAILEISNCVITVKWLPMPLDFCLLFGYLHIVVCLWNDSEFLGIGSLYFGCCKPVICFRIVVSGMHT